MRVVDTSAWIEVLSASVLGRAIEAEFPPRGEWIVPTIVQLENCKWLTRELDDDEADRVIAFTTTCVVIDLDTTIALSAAELGARYKLSTADAIIYATAQAYEADLLTCDRHFENLPGVRYLPQSSHSL